MARRQCPTWHSWLIGCHSFGPLSWLFLTYRVVWLGAPLPTTSGWLPSAHPSGFWYLFPDICFPDAHQFWTGCLSWPTHWLVLVFITFGFLHSWVYVQAGFGLLSGLLLLPYRDNWSRRFTDRHAGSEPKLGHCYVAF